MIDPSLVKHLRARKCLARPIPAPLDFLLVKVMMADHCQDDQLDDRPRICFALFWSLPARILTQRSHSFATIAMWLLWPPYNVEGPFSLFCSLIFIVSVQLNGLNTLSFNLILTTEILYSTDWKTVINLSTLDRGSRSLLMLNLWKAKYGQTNASIVSNLSFKFAQRLPKTDYLQSWGGCKFLAICL